MPECSTFEVSQIWGSLREDYNLLLGGGRGGGKSFALMLLILRHLNDRGRTARILVTRRRQRSLQQFGEELRHLLASAFGKVAFDGASLIFRTPAGGTVQLAHADQPQALADVVQGMSFTLIIVDEAGDAPRMDVLDQMSLSLRGEPPLRMILAANPGGLNHSALAERYITGHTPWAPFEHAGKEWVYAPSIVEDNPHLPEAYRINFEALRHSDEALYKAHRYGDWSAIVGDFFGSAWSPKLVFDHHHVPPHLFSDLKLGIDWGSAKPCATILGGRLSRDVRLPDDRVIPHGAFVVYDEHVEHDPNNIARGTNRTPSEIAPKLIDLARRNGSLARGVIDAAANARTAGGDLTIVRMFDRAGVNLLPAPKGPRVPRFETLKQMMVEGDFWVADRCRFWLGTVPALPRSKKNPEDVDTEANDHALDATSYLVEADSRRLRQGDF